MSIVFRPIEAWPGELLADAQRETARFAASWASTVSLLNREVAMLSVDGPRVDPEIVVQVAVPESSIRLDGALRGDRQAPAHPGVIVSFESRHGSLRYSTDRFSCAVNYRDGRSRRMDGWRANVRAIALALEALRTVDRYGVSHGGEQYRGWNALGSGTAMEGGTHDRRSLAKFIATAAGFEDPDALDPDDVDEVELAFRRAARAHHPDHGGRPQMMTYLNMARKTLVG